jgi:hypothetical protein
MASHRGFSPVEEVEHRTMTKKTPGSGPGGTTFVVLITLIVLLMLFSVVMWELGNEGLAAAAGTVVIGLIGDICRRLLGGDDSPPTPAAPAGSAPAGSAPAGSAPAGSAPAGSLPSTADPVSGSAVIADPAEPSKQLQEPPVGGQAAV